jgi:hypothetical protein
MSVSKIIEPPTPQVLQYLINGKRVFVGHSEKRMVRNLAGPGLSRGYNGPLDLAVIEDCYLLAPFQCTEDFVHFITEINY